jgi:hypothetical protein
LVPTFGLLFLPFRFKHFLLGIFFISNIRKKGKTQRKKNRREEKKMERKERTYLFFSCFCIWDETLLLLSPLHIPSTLSSPPSSSLVSHVSLKLCATQAPKLSWVLKMEWAGNEVKEVERRGGGSRSEGKILGQRRGLKNPFGKGRGCVFGSSPKWLEWPHPELVHWWLLVHSSP